MLMFDVQSDGCSYDKFTFQHDNLEDCLTLKPHIQSATVYSAELESHIIQNNLFNTHIATPFLEEQLAKSIMHFKRASEVRETPLDSIHKVPVPIRKALRIGKFRRVIEIRQNIDTHSLKKREVTDELSIKVRRLSPRLNERMTRNDNYQSGQSDNPELTQKQSRQSKATTFETRYHSLNKKQRMHFTEYKNVFPCSPARKYRNSIETAIIKEVNEISKKHLVPIRKNSQERDMPKKFKGAHFLNIEAMKPTERRDSTIKYLKNNCIMPQINEMVKIYNGQTDEQTPIQERQPYSSSCSGLAQMPLPTLSYVHPRSESSPKKPTKQKPFVPPFQRFYYRDFIWKLNFANNIEVETPQQYAKSLKVYIGPGNNKLLVKGLMKRRSWWTISERYEECHFAWTQIKIPDIFRNQKKNQNQRQIVQRIEDKKQDKILNGSDVKLWEKYFSYYRGVENKLNEQMTNRKKYLKKDNVVKVDQLKLHIHNHFQNNYVIGNKKALFYTMSKYYELTKQNISDYLPMTFHIESGLDDPIYMKFLNNFYERAKIVKKQEKQEPNCQKKKRNVWIVKPGEFTNRGTGITVCLTLDQIKTLIKTKEKHPNGNVKTYIVQSYLDRPFLYYRRKFDIRHYIMVTSINGIIRGYWYEQGYIRTTSFEYTLKSNTTGIHLTNDAIQKYLPEYGKYEKGNKLSYADFQKYLEKEYGKKYNFFTDAYPTMKKIATDAIRASFMTIDKDKRQHNFEVFGMDFMIDEDFHPWLIEINTNPCLQLSCPLLGRIIPAMVENALRIGLDPLFPPPANLVVKPNSFTDNAHETNRFELIFDELVDGPEIMCLYDNTTYKPDKQIENISDDDEVYEDEGKQWEENV